MLLKNKENYLSNSMSIFFASLQQVKQPVIVKLQMLLYG